jgi:hypothetical protein
VLHNPFGAPPQPHLLCSCARRRRTLRNQRSALVPVATAWATAALAATAPTGLQLPSRAGLAAQTLPDLSQCGPDSHQARAEGVAVQIDHVQMHQLAQAWQQRV